MRFRVFGQVAAYTERGPVELGPARQRAVLAALLVEPGSFVPIDQLVDRVWGSAPPARARQVLHSYLSRLRSLLGAAGGPALVRRAGGYALEMPASMVDMHRFRELVAQARNAGEDEPAAALWREALALWQGEPFADLDGDWFRQAAVGLKGEHAAALRDCADVRLRRGEHAELLPELVAAADEHPFDERAVGQLMLALYRCGRQADALARYRMLHDRLVEEVGSDPGSELRELHYRILRQDPELGVAASGNPAPGPQPLDPPARPAQLPADVAGFTGRTDVLGRLDELLPGTGDPGTHAVVITAIGGTAGVGKTALAVHWAHRIVDSFPDGQLYLNLRGYDPDQPVDPADALARFLTALGVAGQDIPLDLDARAARYRSELVGRRMLIVLDNAASAAQVRPLLPGADSCLVVVTSRDSLAGLVAVHGARRLDLDLLGPGEAVELLRRLIGDRVAGEPQAAARLAEQCARLPLAVRVAAELVASRPDSSLAELVTELEDRQQRLKLLDAGDDPHAALQEVFSWSVRQLPVDAARVFRLLGLHPGPDFDPYAAAALAGTGLEAARRTLERLARAHLVHRSGRGRYGMHDLLRAYAAHLATIEESAPQRAAAEDQLLAYYQAAAMSAMDTMYAGEAYRKPADPAAGPAVPDFVDAESARVWLDAERPCLVAVAVHAAAQDRSEYVVGLARSLHRHLMEAQVVDHVTINRHALDVAERVGDDHGQAYALQYLGVAYGRLGQYKVAGEYHERALPRFRRADDPIGEGNTLTGIGTVHQRLGNYPEAIDGFLQATEVFGRVGYRVGEAGGFHNVAIVEKRLGRLVEAAAHGRQAVAIFREHGARHSEGIALANLADVDLQQGRYDAATEYLRRSLTLLEQPDHPIAMAYTLDTFGRLHLHRGEPERAADYFSQALARFRATGHKSGEEWSLNGLGEAALLAGRPADAVPHHTGALAIAVETGSRQQEARAHADLGHAHRALGDPARARSHYEMAYAGYAELDMNHVEDVRAYLDLLARTATAESRAGGAEPETGGAEPETGVAGSRAAAAEPETAVGEPETAAAE